MKRLVIDTETTGLSYRFNKTLTVGMLLVDVTEDHLDILNSNHIFIRHSGGSVSSGAMKVNGINLSEQAEGSSSAARFHPISLVLIIPAYLGYLISENHKPVTEYFLSAGRFDVGGFGITAYIALLVVSIILALDIIMNEVA